MSPQAPTVTTTVTELPESRVRVNVQVAPAELERRIEQSAKKLGRQLRVPGFRKGKVPAQVVARRLGREAVLDEAVRDWLGNWYVEAVDAADLVTVGEPSVDVGEMPPTGSPLSFTIEIGVRPTATLGEYLGVTVPRREPNVDEEAIDGEIERMRERLGTLETVDRAAALGDSIVMDYVGKLDGEPFDGGEARDQLLELGSGRLIPGFEEQLVGASAGDERLVELTFPDDYGAENLAGQDATFEVTVTEVKAKQLPELDDDFATEAAGFDTIAELREDIAARMREVEEQTVTQEYERAVIDAVAAAAEVEVPAALVHARAHEMIEETMTALSRQGIDKDMYLRITGQDEEQLAHEAEPEAERSLRREAVIAAVVTAEGIDPSDDEVLAELGEAAERAKTTPDKMLTQLRENGRLGRVKDDLAHRQALKRLIDAAVPVPAADEPAPAPAKAAEAAETA